MTEHGWKMMGELAQRLGLDAQIAEKLPDLITTAGFINVTSEDRNASLNGSSDHPKRTRKGTLEAFRVVNEAYSKSTGSGFESFSSLMSTMEKEWNEIEDVKECFRVIYGQKPFS